MHISKEFLIEAVGLSLLVALLLISVRIFERTVHITDLVKEEQEQRILEIEEYEIMQYDGMFLDGMTVIGYIKNMVDNYSLPVHVTTEQNSYIVEDSEWYTLFRNPDSVYYIHPFMLYFCDVCRDENGSITEIQITVKEGNR